MCRKHLALLDHDKGEVGHFKSDPRPQGWRNGNDPGQDFRESW